MSSKPSKTKPLTPGIKACRKATRKMKIKFDLGYVRCTVAAQRILSEFQVRPDTLLAKHAAGDQLSFIDLLCGSRLVSSFSLAPTDEWAVSEEAGGMLIDIGKVWALTTPITETSSEMIGMRRTTTILLPHEFNDYPDCEYTN